MLNYAEFFDKYGSPSICTVTLGKLYLPSGHIYCCDPFISHEVGVLETPVPPGAYEVQVCMVRLPEWGKRVALARIVFSSKPVVRWQEAIYALDAVRQSEFRVDSGLACFMDQRTRELFIRVVNEYHATGREANYYDDVLAAQFKENADPSNPYHAGNWAMHAPKKSDDRNLAMFASGLGDGTYCAHWGLDAGGKPAMLVADFNLLPLENT